LPREVEVKDIFWCLLGLSPARATAQADINYITSRIGG